MNKEKLTWEAPQLLLVDVHATLSGASTYVNEQSWCFPSSGFN